LAPASVAFSSALASPSVSFVVRDHTTLKKKINCRFHLSQSSHCTFVESTELDGICNNATTAENGNLLKKSFAFHGKFLYEKRTAKLETVNIFY
jgi:hypothetical protein